MKIKKLKRKILFDYTELELDKISKNPLSKNFIIEFQDKLNQYFISTEQKLNEQLIRKFQHKVCQSLISIKQKLSEKFIKKFKNKLNFNYLSFNKK